MGKLLAEVSATYNKMTSHMVQFQTNVEMRHFASLVHQKKLSQRLKENEQKESDLITQCEDSMTQLALAQSEKEELQRKNEDLQQQLFLQFSQLQQQEHQTWEATQKFCLERCGELSSLVATFSEILSSVT